MGTQRHYAMEIKINQLVVSTAKALDEDFVEDINPHSAHENIYKTIAVRVRSELPRRADSRNNGNANY